MSETEMNFGPEWLRAMSDSGPNKNSNPNAYNLNSNSQNNSSANMPSFQLKMADYRYSRDEMLALWNNKIKMQPKMKEFTGLVTEKCQTPLSLIPMSEEEQRNFSTSMNSMNALRIANKQSSVNNQNGPNSPNATLNGGPQSTENFERNTTNSLDNRGLNLRASGLRTNLSDRGRGRARAFIRNLSYEDEITGSSETNSGINSYLPTTANDNLRTRDSYRSKNNFDRSSSNNAGDDLVNAANQRDTKPPFERQFSKPPPINNENSDPDATNTGTSRLNFRNKAQTSSQDSQQNDSSWRSNRSSNVRTDNTRRNLDWRNKYRSDDTTTNSNTSNNNNGNNNNTSNTTNTQTQLGEWKRNNTTSNDRWRNDHETEDSETDRRRFNFNHKSSLNSKEKSSWDDDHLYNKRNNLPEWSLDDVAVLDHKFGTFDSTGQFREEPIVESPFTMKQNNSQHSTTSTSGTVVANSKSNVTDDWFMNAKEKLADVTANKFMNNMKDEKLTTMSNFTTSSLTNNDHHLTNSMLSKPKSMIDDKNMKLTQNLFDDLMNKASASSLVNPQNVSMKQQQVNVKNNHIDSQADSDIERKKYTQNFISSLIRQSQQTQNSDNLSPLQQLKQANEKDQLANTNQESFFDTFNLNSVMNMNPSTYAQQLSHHFAKTHQSNNNEQVDASRLFENLLEAKNKYKQQQQQHQQQQQQQQHKISANNQIDSTNEKLTKLTLGESSKSDVQNLLESIASKQNQVQANFGLNHPDVQSMFSLSETEKLLKEINKSSSSVIKQQMGITSQAVNHLNAQQSQQQPTFKSIYSNENHQLNERAATNLVNQWTTNQQQQSAVQLTQHQQSNDHHQQAQDELHSKERVPKTAVFPPNHEFGQRWFYLDPQKEVQGPFSSNDMLDWYKGGYFTMDLLVRRGCDEVFSKLGELIETLKRIPFVSIGDNYPPPILLMKKTQQPHPPLQQTQPEINVNPQQLNPAAVLSSMVVPQPGPLQMPNQAALFQMISPTTQDFANSVAGTQMAAMPIVLNQQLHDQQKTLFLRQMQQQQQQFMMDPLMQAAQFRQLFGQLNPNALNQLQQPQQQQQQQQSQQQQQQQQVQQQQVQQQQVQQQVQQQQQQVQQQSAVSNQSSQPSTSQPPPQQPQAQPQRNTQAQQLLNEETSSITSNNSSLNMNPMIKQILAKSSQSNICNTNGDQMMSVAVIEAMHRKEQDLRDNEENKRQHADNMIAEKQVRKTEAEPKRVKKSEPVEEPRDDEGRFVTINEQSQKAKLEAKEMQELIKKQLNRRKQLEQEQAQKQQQLIEQQQAKQRQQDQHQQMIASESYQQQITQSKSTSSSSPTQPQKKKGWAVISTDQPTSLDEIQKLQETTEREERLKQTQQMLQMIQENQMNQKSKGWGNVMNKVSTTQPIKTLDEIQREESERLARLKKIEEENQATQLPPQSVGVWGNAANLQWKAASPLNIWGNQQQTNDSNSGTNSNLDFSNDSQSAVNEPSPWSDSNGISISESQFKKHDSALQQLNSIRNTAGQLQAATVGSVNKKSGTVKSKTGKDDAATPLQTQNSSASSLGNSTGSSGKKLNQKMPTDEFSKWCIEALSQFKEITDKPTFISFLKDVESPHDVNDYVFSYLGETKESKEFSKRFIEKRSFYKNQAKKTSKENEEILLGPARAIIPASFIKGKVEESEFSIFKSGKRKKKSGKKNDAME